MSVWISRCWQQKIRSTNTQPKPKLTSSVLVASKSRIVLQVCLVLSVLVQWISFQRHMELSDLDHRPVALRSWKSTSLTHRNATAMPRLGLQQVYWQALGTDEDSYWLPPFNALKSFNFSITAAFHLSGCEPKFEVSLPNNQDNRGNKTASSSGATFLFKPAQRTNDALNELLAYHIDTLFEFHRVPPVMPVEIPLSRILPAIDADILRQNYNRVKCNMHFEQERINRWITVPRTTLSQNFSIGEETMVIGTMQLKLDGIIQRGETVRWLDQTISTLLRMAPRMLRQRVHAALFSMDSSIVTQRERGTRALFDFLVGNVDRFNNDFTLMGPTPLQESTAPDSNHFLVYIDNNRVSRKVEAFSLKEATSSCRFYREPIEQIANLTHPRDVLLYSIKKRHGGLVRQWLKYHPIRKKVTNPYTKISMLNHFEQRIQRVLRRVAECVSTNGFDHVFVES